MFQSYMKKILYSIPLLVIVMFSVTSEPAQALSCLPTDMYISSVIGNDETVIFAAKSNATIETTNYTAEALTVITSYQGYMDGKVMVYHPKHSDWGYLCNSGPRGNNTEGVYIATRDHSGKYNVTQRLELNSDLLPTIKDQLKDKEIAGEITPFNKTARIEQISTTIMDLLTEIMVLLKEQMYWRDAK